MSVYRRGNVWWVDIYISQKDRRIRVSTGSKDRNDAVIIEQALLSAAARTKPKQRIIGIINELMGDDTTSLALSGTQTFYSTCVQSEGIRLSKQTMYTRFRIIGKFYVWANENTPCKVVSDVTPQIAWLFSETLGKSGMSVKTRNNYLTELGTVWTMLIKRGVARANPWQSVRVQRNPEEEKTGRAFTQDEEDRILRAAREAGFEWYEACLLSRYTGLRQKDVINLKWDSVDMERRRITVTPSKTARHSIDVGVPIHERLFAMLSGMKRTTAYVLPWRHEHDGKIKPRHGDCTFADIMRAAGVAGEGKFKLTFHCWRHTFISRLAEAGVPEDVRMSLAGHSSTDTHAIYNHSWAPLEQAISSLK